MIFDAITFMSLLWEISFIFKMNLPKIEVHCNGFEEDYICISVEEYENMTLWTNNTMIKHNHLCNLLNDK